MRTKKIGTCEVCECTDDFGCEEGCEWVTPTLCSMCVPDKWQWKACPPKIRRNTMRRNAWLRGWQAGRRYAAIGIKRSCPEHHEELIDAWRKGRAAYVESVATP